MTKLFPPAPKQKKPAKKRVWAEDPKNPKTLGYMNGTPELARQITEARTWWAKPENRKKAFDHVSTLLVAGKGVREIRRSMRGTWPIGQSKIERICKRIKEEWLLDDVENRKSLRGIHARRVLEELTEARLDRSWSAVFAGEATYGKITGTILPENVHVHMDRVELVQQVIGSLDDARLKELYDRQLAREKLLERAGLSVPVIRDGEVIDIDPSQVQTEVEATLIERAVEGDAE
jgi:hypothetical protein